MKKIVLFDFDGVIADTFNIAYGIMHGQFPTISVEEYRKGFDININDAIRQWKKLGLKVEKVREAEFFKEYTPRVLNTAPFPGMIDVIKKLSEKYILLIISSTISGSIRQYLEKHGLSSYFAEIFGNEIQKSKVEKLKMAMKKYRLAPDDCVLITDTLGDIREADQVNVKSLAVSWGYHSLSTLQKGRPLAIINRPEELVLQIEKIFNKATT